MNVLEIFGMAFAGTFAKVAALAAAAAGIVSALVCIITCMACLVALLSQLCGQIPAVKRLREEKEQQKKKKEQEQQKKEQEQQKTLLCIDDLAEFLAGPCASNAAALEAKWPDWEERLDGACPLATAIALEKGVYSAALVRRELEKLKTKEEQVKKKKKKKEDRHD